MQHLQKTQGAEMPWRPTSCTSIPVRCLDLSPLFATLPKTPGVWGYSSHFGTTPTPSKSARVRVLSSAVLLALRTGKRAGMTARILDGTKIRDQIFAELKDEVRLLTAAGVRPGLAAVLVGENPASQLYVKSKIAACEEIGLASALITPPATVTTLDLLAVVEDLNRDNNVDGILIQLPLPSQVDTKRILEAVDPAKDVDGFH